MRGKCINQQDIKQANAADVFSIIRKNGPLLRSQLQEITNLSWGAVSNIVSRLSEEKYIVETKAEGRGSAGRLPSYLDVNTNDHFIIGFDINASGFKAVLMNLKGEVIERYKRIPTYKDKDSMLNEIFEFSQQVKRSTERYHILCAGVAMQGLVDSQNGISIQGPMLTDWENVPLADMLEQHLSIPVFLEHDPNCSLYAFSVRKNIDSIILVRVDRGIGMAVMIGGEIFKRIGMFELGHSIVETNGARCTCGKCGCMEAYASQSGMERLSGMSFEALAQKARSGDTFATELFNNMADYLSKELSNIAHLLCVNNIVLCGDMWRYRDIFEERFNKGLAAAADGKLNIQIAETEHAATGAALIAIERFSDKIEF